MDRAITTRFFAQVCAVTGGDTTMVVDCRSAIAQPLRLTDEETWDAVDGLLSDRLLESALMSGVHVRLTDTGARRCIEDQHRSVD